MPQPNEAKWTIKASFVLGGWSRDASNLTELADAVAEGIEASPCGEVTVRSYPWSAGVRGVLPNTPNKAGAQAKEPRDLDTPTDPSPAQEKPRRFPYGMNAEDHAPTCDIRTSRDGWDADCTCGVLAASPAQEKPK